jgi:hypothetical protein
MPRKKKAAKAESPPAVPVPAKSYIVAKCQWCGMRWKHYGDETPAHYCGKVCEEHARTSKELADEEAAAEAAPE